MSNQPQAHVADERELLPCPCCDSVAYLHSKSSTSSNAYAVECTGCNLSTSWASQIDHPISEWNRRSSKSLKQVSANFGDGEWKIAEAISEMPDVDETFRGLIADPTGDNATCLVRAILRAARAAIPAGADVATLEYRTCCDHPDCVTCGGRGGFYRLAAGAPAETPKPVGKLHYCRVNDDWDVTISDDYMAGLVDGCNIYLTAQPAPAPATDARRSPTLTEMQAIIRKGSLVSNTDAWTIAENVLSMLSDNSPREAG